MIKLEIIDHRNLGQVMDKLTSLIEKSRVVFVPFHNDPFAISEARTLRKIIRNAANQITGAQSVVFKHPRQHRGGGRLAMCAGHHDRAFAANECLLQKFGQRAVPKLPFQYSLCLGVSATDGITDHHQIRRVG